MQLASKQSVDCNGGLMTSIQSVFSFRTDKIFGAALHSGTGVATGPDMKTIWTFPKIGKWVSATAMLVLLGCSSTRYERTTGEFIDDKRLVGRVKHSLNAQPVYKYPDVKVQTYRGVVQLSGFVATEAQKEAATEIAERTRGVAKVENDIMIAPLEQTSLRDYIPGRTTNETQSSGAPSSRTTTTSGSITNK